MSKNFQLAGGRNVGKEIAVGEYSELIAQMYRISGMAEINISKAMAVPDELMGDHRGSNVIVW